MRINAYTRKCWKVLSLTNFSKSIQTSKFLLGSLLGEAEKFLAFFLYVHVMLLLNLGFYNCIAIVKKCNFTKSKHFKKVSAMKEKRNLFHVFYYFATIANNKITEIASSTELLSEKKHKKWICIYRRKIFQQKFYLET